MHLRLLCVELVSNNPFLWLVDVVKHGGCSIYVLLTSVNPMLCRRRVSHNGMFDQASRV